MSLHRHLHLLLPLLRLHPSHLVVPPPSYLNSPQLSCLSSWRRGLTNSHKGSNEAEALTSKPNMSNNPEVATSTRLLRRSASTGARGFFFSSAVEVESDDTRESTETSARVALIGSLSESDVIDANQEGAFAHTSIGFRVEKKRSVRRIRYPYQRT